MSNKEQGLMEKLMANSKGLSRRYPDGNEPFQIMTRLLEECGELAKEVNHFEGSGIKREKYGDPDKTRLAKEVQQVLQCALQIAQFYEIESELEVSVERSYQRLKTTSFI